MDFEAAMQKLLETLELDAFGDMSPEQYAKFESLLKTTVKNRKPRTRTR